MISDSGLLVERCVTGSIVGRFRCLVDAAHLCLCVQDCCFGTAICWLSVGRSAYLVQWIDVMSWDPAVG